MHALQLLKQQLTCIGNVNSNNLCVSTLLSLSALVTSVLFSTVVGNGLLATVLTDIDGIEV